MFIKHSIVIRKGKIVFYSELLKVIIFAAKMRTNKKVFNE